jgi:crotonobetainyl-CoA hydratase
VSVSVEIEGQCARVTIDRPDVRNALGLQHQALLEDAWARIERDPAVRVAVLTGAGEQAFCAGADMKAGDPEGADYLACERPHGFGGISLRGSLLMPLIARVNGHALGGGFEMVLGCDLAVAVEEATFGLPEPLVGRVAVDGGVALLSRALPSKLARELLLTGRRIDAGDALALGLVNRVVPRAELDVAVAELVERLLAAAPLSQRAIKDLLRRGEGLDPRAATALAPPSLLRALTSADGTEGSRAFREKRTPRWEAQ